MQLPNGSALAIASTYATSKNMTALTNATEGVATLEASHGILVGDVFEVTSGWGPLDQRIARAKTVATNDVTLEGINTLTPAAFYPTGTGTGTIREVSAWTPITQIMELNSSGGDQQFYQYLFVDDPSFTQKQIPTFKNPIGLNMKLADDQTKPWYEAILAAAQARTNYALRITLPSGGKIYLNGIWTMNEMPTLTANEGMAIDVTFSLQAPPTRYTS